MQVNRRKEWRGEGRGDRKEKGNEERGKEERRKTEGERKGTGSHASNGGYMILVESECVEMGEGGKGEAVIGKIIVVKNQFFKGLEVTNTFE